MKGCSFAKSALHPDKTMTTLDDSMNNGKTESGPLTNLLGGKMRGVTLEQMSTYNGRPQRRSW